MVSANNEVDLYNQLQNAGYELIDCGILAQDNKNTSLAFLQKKITTRDMIQLFVHLEQMQSAGIPLLDCLSDIRDAMDHDRLRDILSEINKDVSEGSALSEAMARHPKIFKPIYISLIAAGEETGDLPAVYKQLIKYLKWMDDMRSKVKKATTYPTIVLIVVMLTITIMMTLVVPQVVGFIENMDQEVPIYTKALIATSEFFQNFWWLILLLPGLVFIGIKIVKAVSSQMAVQVDSILLNMPIMGPITRKISISRYCQTFGALFSSGIDVVGALKSSRKTVTNLALVTALDSVEEYVQAGSPLSEAFDASGEFPSMVVRMLKIGEESGNLTQVLEQVSEFYNKDVDDAIQALISMIEPALTGLLGGMIAWIAISVFGPIYSSFENLDF